jgi:hypothetical protein
MEGAMKVKFEKVIDGINRYIDKEIYCNLNDWQEMLARIVVGRFVKNTDSLKNYLMSNGFCKTLCLVDSDGMVDIESILYDIREEIGRKGCIQVEIPLIGTLTFRENNVDVLLREIDGGY